MISTSKWNYSLVEIHNTHPLENFLPMLMDIYWSKFVELVRSVTSFIPLFPEFSFDISDQEHRGQL